MEGKHYLVIDRFEDIFDIDWHVEHPEGCIQPVDYRGQIFWEYACPEGFEIENVGLDAFDALPNEPGKWVIKAWHVRHAGLDGEEFDGGMEILERVE